MTPLAVGAQVEHQSPALVTAESRDDFAAVSGVRELSDGRVLLVDGHLLRVFLLSPELSASRTVGGPGQGPGEYERPSAIFPMAGDSSAVLDTALGRILIIPPDGAAGRIVRLDPSGSPAVGTAFMITRDGSLYHEGQPLDPSPTGTVVVSDSAAIERWREGSTRRDTVAFVPVPQVPGRRVRSGMVVTPPFASPPFSSRAQWTVAGDGTLAVVHPDPYRVEIIHPDGRQRHGSPVAFDPIPVSEGHRQAWREEQQRPAPVTVFSRSGETSGMEMRAPPPPPEPREWPRTLPPFLPGAARFAPDGTLWVQRTTEPGAPPTFDVFELAPALAPPSRVTIPQGTRLVGFGAESIYVVRRDPLGREFLQRIRMP